MTLILTSSFEWLVFLIFLKDDSLHWVYSNAKIDCTQVWGRILPCFESFFASICLNLAPVFICNNWAFALDGFEEIFQERLCWLDCSDRCRSPEMPVPLGLSGSPRDVLGGREGSGGYAGWVVRKQATGTLATLGSLSLSLCLNQLPAGDAPSCHPPAAHGPPYASLRKDIREWRVVPWPAIAAPSGADPPTCDLSLLGNCLPSSAVLFLHWHVAFVSFFTHGQWSLVNWS